MDINIKTIIESLYTETNSIELGTTLYKKNPDFLKDYLEFVFPKLELSQKKELLKTISKEDSFDYKDFLNFKNSLEMEHLNNRIDSAEYYKMSVSIILAFLKNSLNQSEKTQECNNAIHFLNSLETIFTELNHYERKINLLHQVYDKTTIFENIAPLFQSIIEDKNFSKDDFFTKDEIKEVYKRNPLHLGEKTEIFFEKNDKEFYNFIVCQYILSKNRDVLTPKMAINKEHMYSIIIANSELEQLKEITKKVKIETSLAQLLLNSKASCEFIEHFSNLKSYKRILVSNNKVFTPIIITKMIDDENFSLESLKKICNNDFLNMLITDKYKHVFNLIKESYVSINEKTQYLSEKLDIPLKDTILISNNKTKKFVSLLKKPKEVQYLLQLTKDDENPVFHSINLYNVVSNAAFSEYSLNDINNKDLEQFFKLMYKNTTLPDIIEKFNAHNFSAFKASVEEKRVKIQNLLEKKIIENSIEKIEEKNNNKKMKI
jgi:hypothetical protein